MWKSSSLVAIIYFWHSHITYALGPDLCQRLRGGWTLNDSRNRFKLTDTAAAHVDMVQRHATSVATVMLHDDLLDCMCIVVCVHARGDVVCVYVHEHVCVCACM